MDGQDGQDEEEMRIGMMNKIQLVFHLSFRIPHSAFVFYPAYPAHPCLNLCCFNLIAKQVEGDVRRRRGKPPP
jgi:hypothetical protein